MDEPIDRLLRACGLRSFPYLRYPPVRIEAQAPEAATGPLTTQQDETYRVNGEGTPSASPSHDDVPRPPPSRARLTRLRRPRALSAMRATIQPASSTASASPPPEPPAAPKPHVERREIQPLPAAHPVPTSPEPSHPETRYMGVSPLARHAAMAPAFRSAPPSFQPTTPSIRRFALLDEISARRITSPEASPFRGMTLPPPAPPAEPLPASPRLRVRRRPRLQDGT